ncbi:uncharacterized protein LOC123529381 [Mercenaria mercenaria]|uniref:uncharacterized protein LOC123529381 n=1 Tax=Mercenaria mercenaria TaxID=6596 RepID=UPI00234EEC01|nr:uncharacterized protein LOC123529381 [Mercenaria mercenaria]
MANKGNLPDMIKQISKKRKHVSTCETDSLPATKRPRMMTRVSKRFEQKCWEWRERRRKIALGIVLYWEAQMRNAHRMARKRAISERYVDYVGMVKSKYIKLFQDTFLPSIPPLSLSPLILATNGGAEETAKIKEAAMNGVPAPAQKRRLIRRLSGDVDAKEAPEVKVNPAPRRLGWRRKGEKRT